MPDTVAQALETVINSIPDARQGLPDPVFEFVLKTTTMINVDLLIEQPDRGILLTWRVDNFGTGWHIPGGIIRLYEPIESRIAEVARLELGASVAAEDFPCKIQQFFRRRGHFISLLYRCRLTSPFSDPTMLHREGVPRHGAIGWFIGPPQEIYPGHEVYASLMGQPPRLFSKKG